MNSEALAETMEAMEFLTQETVDRRIAGWKRTHPNDELGQRMYIESMIELLQLISRQGSERRDAKS